MNFFSTRKPRQFIHRPIYWDPRKEESEEREKRVDSELKYQTRSENNYIPKYARKGMFVNSSACLGKKKHGPIRQMFFKNTVLSVLIALLTALIYFIYFN